MPKTSFHMPSGTSQVPNRIIPIGSNLGHCRLAIVESISQNDPSLPARSIWLPTDRCMFFIAIIWHDRQHMFQTETFILGKQFHFIRLQKDRLRSRSLHFEQINKFIKKIFRFSFISSSSSRIINYALCWNKMGPWIFIRETEIIAKQKHLSIKS